MSTPHEPTLFDSTPGHGSTLAEAVMQDGSTTEHRFPADPGCMVADIIRDWQADGWECTTSTHPLTVTGARDGLHRQITLRRLP